MNDEKKIWAELPKFSEGYISGVKRFIQNTFSRFAVGDEITCPCKKCHNRMWHRQEVVYDHLIWNGPSELYVKWICEVSCLDPERSGKDMDREAGIKFGDNLDEMLHHTCRNMQNNEGGPFDGANGVDVDARKFHHRVEEGKQPLYPGCTEFSRLSFIVRLYSLKCLHGITESAFIDLLELLKEAFPQAHIPLSFNATKNITKDLGLDFQRIHACPNADMSNKLDGELFVKTRKRKEGKVYKTDTSVMKYKIDKIEKAIGEGGSDGVVQEIISDGKLHGRSWLIGRHTKFAEVLKYAPTTSTYIMELAAKIRENIADEVEEKVNKKVQNEFDAKVNQKVRENLTWVLKKLGEANPDMQIDVGDLCATIYSDGTGGTGGTRGSDGTGCSQI